MRREGTGFVQVLFPAHFLKIAALSFDLGKSTTALAAGGLRCARNGGACISINGVFRFDRHDVASDGLPTCQMFQISHTLISGWSVHVLFRLALFFAYPKCCSEIPSGA